MLPATRLIIELFNALRDGPLADSEWIRSTDLLTHPRAKAVVGDLNALLEQNAHRRVITWCWACAHEIDSAARSEYCPKCGNLRWETFRLLVA